MPLDKLPTRVRRWIVGKNRLLMADSIKLSDKLIANAKLVANMQNRSVPEQIEHYFRIAQIAEQNPDLTFNLIQELLKAMSQPTTQEYKLQQGS